MKNLNYISLIIMIAASLFTINAIAAPAHSKNLSVHLYDNLEDKDLRLVKKIMEERGYLVVDKKEIFSESSKTIMITKAIADEREPASYEVEVLSLEKNAALPTSVFNKKIITDSLQEALNALPKSGDLPILGSK